MLRSYLCAHLDSFFATATQRTWQRLTTTGIFHDAIPYPCERLGYPMHVKVSFCNEFTSDYCSVEPVIEVFFY